MALKYSSELLNLILSELPIEIAVLDINFKYVLVNNKAISNNQLRDWIIGKDDFEYCNFRKRDPEIAINRRKYFDKLLQTKAEVQWEEVLISNSGEELVFLRRYLPVINEAEEIQYVIGYGVDSNESRYLRNELDEKSSLLELIFESSPSVMFLKDRKGRYDLVNKAFEELFNLSSDEIINKSTAEFHQEKSEVDHFSTIDNQVINTLARVRVEEPFTSSNGEKRWLDTIKVPIKIKGEVIVKPEVNVLEPKKNLLMTK
jgi:PAS domain S-box-containing protein